MAASLDIRQLSRSELILVGEIDRTEHIDVLYVRDGDRLERPTPESMRGIGRVVFDHLDDVEALIERASESRD